MNIGLLVFSFMSAVLFAGLASRSFDYENEYVYVPITSIIGLVLSVAAFVLSLLWDTILF